MKNFKRGERRTQAENAQKHAESVLRAQRVAETPEEIKKRARKIRDHVKSCSCEMCRNPRRSKWNKSHRLSIQEKKKNVED